MFQSFVGAFRRKVTLPAIAKVMDMSGKAFVMEARRLCPVDTGALQASIGYTYNAQTQTLNCYADKSYAVMVEMGTRFQRPQPYLRPAMNAISAVWKGSVNVQFPSTHPKYHQRIKDFKYRIHKGVNLQIGHGPFA